MSLVKTQAEKADGASLWLLYRDANNMTEIQQRLREAAAAGFPQAQFELSWALLAPQEGAAGTGAANVSAGGMLPASQGPLSPSEQQLAVCASPGCDGIRVATDASVHPAREAAPRA